ncbi:MAG TPA: hypothetical protein VE955_11645 [Candidatus Dormibacteraeota bacterium]|jgi:hypothetical protein|nr:hypothetical protein [Candidatus Dormibacteraeota bacterium]
MKLASLAVGTALLIIGFAFGELTSVPGYCATSSGYCIEGAPSFRALVSGGTSGVIEGGGVYMVGRASDSGREHRNRVLTLLRDELSYRIRFMSL